MIYLKQSLSAWGKPDFNDQLKAETERLSADELPLQKGLSLSSSVSTEPFRVMVLTTSEEPGVVFVKAGIFYSGIIAGCNCSDDPTPMDVQAEYCEVQLAIDKETAETTVKLVTQSD